MLAVLARQVAGRIELQRRIAIQQEVLAQWTLAERRLSASEERLLFTVESAGIGTWLWDIATNDLMWSDRCKALFGLTADTKVTRERLFESLHPDDRTHTRRAIEKALATGKVYDTEYRIVWPDGTVHWVAARGRGYYDEDGQPLRFEGTVQDIDGRKASEAAARDAARPSESNAARRSGKRHGRQTASGRD